MVKLSDDKTSIVVTVDDMSKTVYLDHWAIRHFSAPKNIKHSEILMSFFDRGATLLISYANVFDIIGNDHLAAYTEPQLNSSNTCFFGAQVSEVDEPLAGHLFRAEPIFTAEFDAVAEPKALTAAELTALARQHGGFAPAARAIGASEGMVRQKAQNKAYNRPS
jgi:hypothetical protein